MKGQSAGRKTTMGKAQPAVKYHGLLNQGATCYLNSVLQVLFMTEEFREALIRSVDENQNTEFFDRQLKDLFLKLRQKRTRTDEIRKALGIDKVCDQRDAAEYFERILGLTAPNAAKVFHGQMASRTTCSVCETRDESDGPFWHLPLDLVDSSSGNFSVEEGIKEFFTATHVSGDDQMYCDRCDAKVDATSRYVIKHHPDVLILLLKRFDFSYESMSYIKINRAVDVPHTLKIPEKQTYELYAVVDHSGNLRSGHYVATIKAQNEDRWYSFDDSRVSQLEESPFLDNRNMLRSDKAYLLFYKKKGDFQSDADVDKEKMKANLNTKRNDETEESNSHENSLQENSKKKKKRQREEEDEKTDRNKNPDFSQNKADDPNTQSRKALKTETQNDEDPLEEERSDTKQEVSGTHETSEDAPGRRNTKQNKWFGNKRAEREKEKKKDSRRKPQGAPERRHRSVKEEIKQKISKKGTNKTPVADKPTSVAEDHSDLLSKQQNQRKRSSGEADMKNRNNQSDVSGLRRLSDVDLQTPEKKKLKKRKSKGSWCFSCFSPHTPEMT